MISRDYQNNWTNDGKRPPFVLFLNKTLYILNLSRIDLLFIFLQMQNVVVKSAVNMLYAKQAYVLAILDMLATVSNVHVSQNFDRIFNLKIWWNF